MAQIQIWTRDVKGTGNLHPYSPQHTFFIKVNDDGTREVLRGGPVDDSMLRGDVIIIRQEYNKPEQDNGIPTSDWYDPSLPNTLHYQGQSIKSATQAEIDSAWQSAVNLAQVINQQGYDYEISSQNCNTVTGHLANAMGLTSEVESFVSAAKLSTPGLDDLFIQGQLDQVYDSFNEAMFGITRDFIIDSLPFSTVLITPHPSESIPNLLPGNPAQDNIMLGKKDEQNTFYIPQFNHDFIIIDPDGTGNIVIGNGSQSVSLNGNAIPKKDALGNIIPNQWTLNGYDLIRSGDNMVIVLAGSDISSGDTPRITINNFPFSNPNAFGLLLGKKVAGLSDTSNFRSDPSLFNQIVFESVGDKRGRFFAPALVARGSSGEKDYAIKIYNSEGFVVATQKLTSLPQSTDTKTVDVGTIGQSYRLGNGNVGFIYTVNEVETNLITGAFVSGNSKAYFAVTDAKGNLVSNAVVKEYQTAEGDALADYQANALQPSHVTSQGICFTAGGNRFFCQGLSAAGSLTGSMSLTSPEQLGQYEAPNQDNTQVNLASGHRITAAARGFNVRDPLYVDMTANEVPDGKSVVAGSIQSPGIQQGIITFQDAVAAATAAELQVTPTPGQRLIITGTANGFVDLSAFDHLTEKQIADQSSEVDSSEFSAEELLAGAYNPSARGRRDVDLGKRNLFSDGEFAVDETELQERARRSADDDDYVEPSQDVVDESLTESPEVFTVLDLGQGQLLIFPGIDQQEFLNRTADLFIGYIPNEVPTIDDGSGQNFTTPWTTVRPFNFTTTSSSQIDGYVPPQIGNGTQSGSNPLAPGSLGFGFLVGGAILFVGGVAVGAYKLATSAETRTSLRDGVLRIGRGIGNAIDPRGWIRSSRTHPQEDAEQGRLEMVTSRTDDPLEDPLDGTTIANEMFAESSAGDKRKGSEDDHDGKSRRVAEEGEEDEELDGPSRSASLRSKDGVTRVKQADLEMAKS